jgi:hypothetical protein
MHSEETQRMILMGVNLMVSTSMNLTRRRSDVDVPLIIKEVESEDEDGEEAVDEMDSEP